MTTTTQTMPSTKPVSAPAEPPDFGAELRAVHLEVADIVAEFDFDDAILWAKTAEIVSAVVTEASDMAASLAGVPSGTPAAGAPPVVRVRELAAAQRRLFSAMDAQTPIDRRPALLESVDRVHGLGQWLSHLARQADGTRP